MNLAEQRVIIISGLSGAGKSIALDSLEDLGFYCIDNLPIGLINGIGNQIKDSESNIYKNIAIGIDARSPKNYILDLPATIDQLKKQIKTVELIFFEASEEILTGRFSETRRKHPLSSNNITLLEAINKEANLMSVLADKADLRVDTSYFSIHELRDWVRTRIANRPLDALSLLFQSFGYKNGLPKDVDFVFDVRCLPNPYWQKDLRKFSGKDKQVIEFLSNQALVTDMYNHIKNFLEYWIPKFENENRSYLGIAIGCTGGTHRSVFLTEKLSRFFLDKNKTVITKHRDLK